MSNRMIKQYRTVHKALIKDTADHKSVVGAIALFKQCVNQFSEASGDDYEDEPIDPELFQNVMQMCLVDLLPAIHKFLKLPSPTAKTEENPDAKPLDPSKSKKWAKMVGCLKVYLSSLLKLMDTVAQDSVLTKLLRHALYLIPFYSQYVNLSKNLLKRVMVIWSQGDEKNRVLAFLIILRIMRRHDSTMISFIMKKLYLAYIKNCKLVSKETWPMISFMQQSLVELYSLDQGVAYQHAFIFIRQCAITLRNASASTEQDAFKTVHNWQYLQSLLLWARLLTCLHPSEVLKPLIHPLVQVFIGTIRHLSIARYYPLRLHIVKALVRLSTTTNTFIPILPLITDILDATNYEKKFKVTQKKNNVDFECLTRVSQNLTDEKSFVESSINKSFELLLEYLSHQSHSIAFPELSYFTLRKIKKFVKKCTVASHGKIMKKLADKIEETSKVIEEKRKHVNFSLKDNNAINQWQNEMKDKGTPLTKYFNEWQKTKDAELQAKLEKEKEKEAEAEAEAEDDNEADEEDEEDYESESEIMQPPKKKKRKQS